MWTWSCEDAEGRAVRAAPTPPGSGFPAQADAETWLGESWRQLVAGGVEQVSLLVDGERVYGPLSLRPTE
ncbi:hypothetical protein SAMN05428996_1252 [Quadrisphaera sp. DSM 44207]|nr:hypothetical protein SAMN05428996_1252 [Quadrisphaera sp. DSM 44207]